MDYKPMLAEELGFSKPKELIKKGWRVSLKCDGERGILYYATNITIRNRRDINITRRYPELWKIKLNCESAVVDGELVCLKNGKPDFQNLQKRAHLEKSSDIEMRMKIYPVHFYVFDLLELNGADYTKKPLSERYEKLKEIFLENDNIHLLPDFDIKDEKDFDEVWDFIKKEGLEGLMLKDENSIYENGVRSWAWRKLKYVKTVDCPIASWEASVGKRGQDGFTLICNYKNKQIRVACNGLADRERIKNHNSKKQLIAEVRYLNQTDSGVLRQPTLKAIKDE